MVPRKLSNRLSERLQQMTLVQSHVENMSIVHGVGNAITTEMHYRSNYFFIRWVFSKIEVHVTRITGVDLHALRKPTETWKIQLLRLQTESTAHVSFPQLWTWINSSNKKISPVILRSSLCGSTYMSVSVSEPDVTDNNKINPLMLIFPYSSMSDIWTENNMKWTLHDSVLSPSSIRWWKNCNLLLVFLAKKTNLTLKLQVTVESYNSGLLTLMHSKNKMYWRIYTKTCHKESPLFQPLRKGKQTCTLSWTY